MADCAFCAEARGGQTERKACANMALGFTFDSSRRIRWSPLCVLENDFVANASYGRRIARRFCRCGRYVIARGVDFVSRGLMDDSGRGDDWTETKTVRDRATYRASGCVGSRDGVVSDYFAAADSGWRRVGCWLDYFAAAGNAVVSAVQCNRRSDSDSHRLERSVQCISLSKERPLAGIIVAGNISVFDYRIRNGVRRRLEREHHRGIFSLSRDYLYDDRTGRGDQQCNGYRKFSRTAGGDNRD